MGWIFVGVGVTIEDQFFSSREGGSEWLEWLPFALGPIHDV
jgi:hypothetical protein